MTYKIHATIWHRFLSSIQEQKPSPGEHITREDKGLGREQASYLSGPMPVALFLLPPSEPDVQLLTASGSPALRFRKVDVILPVHMNPRPLGALLMGLPKVTST